MATNEMIPPPPGFVVDPAQSLPPGFVIDAGKGQSAAKSEPTGIQVAASRAESLGRGIMDPITGGAQLLTHILPDRVVEAGNELNNWMAKYGLTSKIPEKGGLDELIKQDEAKLEKGRADAGRAGTDWFRMGGNVISPANLAIASKIPAAASAAGRIGLGAAQGAASGALAPVTSGDSFAAEKAKQVVGGAAVGGAVPAATGAAARIIKPTGSEAVKNLAEAGVSMTPGQILGGWLQRAEDSATSIPIIGDSIKGAQRRGIVTFNNAAINESLKPIGQKLPKGVEGNDAVAFARKELGKAYDDLLPKLKGELNSAPPANALPNGQATAIKPSFQDELNNIRALGANLPKQQQKDLNRIIDKEVIEKFTSQGKASGETLKNIQEVLNKEAANFATGGPYERTLSGGIKEINSAMRRMINDVNPGYAEELQSINQGYANFKIAQRAASSVGAKDGMFTPAQYHNAVKASDFTKDKRAFSEGAARGQDLSSAGKAVLSQTIPDSGTATRGLIESLVAGGGAHALGVPYAAGALVAPAAYSKLGTKAAQALLLSRPEGAESLAKLVRNSSPALTAGAVPLSRLMMSTQGE